MLDTSCIQNLSTDNLDLKWQLFVLTYKQMWLILIYLKLSCTVHTVIAGVQPTTFTNHGVIKTNLQSVDTEKTTAPKSPNANLVTLTMLCSELLFQPLGV